MLAVPRVRGVLLLVALSLFAFLSSPASAIDSQAARSVFADPPREYSTAPLWVWNDYLTEEQIRLTLRDLAGQKVKQVFVHPRPGLMTPYLSDEWFALWQAALNEAERLDMNVWIYDENSYPSGFAGGWVPELMPESRGRGLRFQIVKALPQVGSDILGVYVKKDGEYSDITEQARAGKSPVADEYLLAKVERAPNRDWTANRCYVDLLHPGVTEKFIELTMEPYRKRFGEQFGKRLPGWFTDEPHLSPFGLPHWSDDLPDRFRERWDYDLLPVLPSLYAPVGEWKRVRHNYFQLLLEEFIDRWAKPCHDYCERNNLEFTGHYWEHGWPMAGHGGDNMAMYAWHQRPAIDTLMNQYDEGVNAQFGNVRSVKELSSVANQLGRERTLCEAYGAGGWDLRFEDMKRIGEWLVVLGVNTIDEHLSFITIRGTRKRDHPQSFSYHEPWWEDYHVMASRLTRLSAATSFGQQVNGVLVLEPTTSAWMYQPDGSGREAAMAIGNQFQDLINRLERKQVEYDLGCEDIMARHGSAAINADKAATLRIGQRDYHTVVLTPLTENLNSSTMKLLEQFVDGGGRVICCGDPPKRVDGVASDRGEEAEKHSSWQRADSADVPALLASSQDDDFSILRADNDQGILFHQRRQLDDGELLLLVNTSIEHSSRGVVQSKSTTAERWLPESGDVEAYPCRPTDSGSQLSFDLPPCGSLLLFLAEGSARPAQRPSEEKPVAANIISPVGEPQIRTLGPNVLPLDFLDVSVKEETRKDIYCYEAALFAFQQHGFEKNPWDHAVQFNDEIIRHKFAEDSGFTATYRFQIAEAVPEDLQIVVERPDLYTITCNGKPVSAAPGKWWLDRAFGRVDLASSAHVGANEVTLTACPMTVFHEIEPTYVLGSFSLNAAEKGWSIVPERPIQLGPWNRQGRPYYAEGVTYTESYRIEEPQGRYIVRVPSWYGSIAAVSVNGHQVGHLVSRPWQVDVSEAIRKGDNQIQLRVVGTLKNTLGPHHGTPVLGKAWPWDFRQAPEQGPPPGNEYHTVQYGLFDRFELVNQP